MRVCACVGACTGARVCVCACMHVVPCAALRFVALLPGSKLSGTIFVLSVKTGDSGAPEYR